MPGYKGHIIGGIAIGIVLILILFYINSKFNLFELSIVNLLAIIPVIMIYSILPDVDISSSKIREWTLSVGLTIIFFTILFDLKLIAVLFTAILFSLQFTKHRKFFHSITAGLIFSLPLVYFHYSIAIFAFIGYLSHLILDKEVNLI